MEMEVPSSRYGRKYKHPIRCSACENCTHGAAGAAAAPPPVSADALSDQLAKVLKVSEQAATVVGDTAATGAAAAAAATATVYASSSEVVIATVVETSELLPVPQLEAIAEPNENADVAAAGKNKKRNARRGRGKGDGAAKRAPLSAKGENGTQTAADENAGVPPASKEAPPAENVTKKKTNPQKELKEQKDEAEEQKEAKGKKGQSQNKVKGGKENVATRQSGRRQKPLKDIQVAVK